jgi:hypothetical protein
MSVHSFFSAPVGVYGNALINWSGNPVEDLISYAHSYRSAAMNLVAFREQRGCGSINESALPILFLYRHSMELYLKAIVYKAAILSINQGEITAALDRLWSLHSLSKLAELAKPAISSAERWLSSNGELNSKIFEFAQQIDAIDPGSYSFRYPVTRHGKATLPSAFLTNIFVFSEHIERVFDDVAQFCRVLDDERIQGSGQMKFSLHQLTRG